VFQQSGTTQKTWAIRGEGTEVESMPCRRSMKYFGAISLDKDPQWIFRATERFNSDSFKRFLKQIMKRIPKKKIYLVLDNARYHHAQKIKDFLAENEDRIQLIFLPSYSPNLNIVERVWKLTKKLATHNRFFASLQESKEAIRRRFNRFQGNPASLRGLVCNHI
jgi:transposase